MEKLIIIDNEIKYEVSPNDLLGYYNLYNSSSKLLESHKTGLMSWDFAMEFCKKMGDDWMLPNKEQLYLMYKKKEYLKMLPLYGYWTRDEHDKKNAHYQYFFTGTQYILDKKVPSFARPIRKI
jgi:hypothetical protein